MLPKSQYIPVIHPDEHYMSVILRWERVHNSFPLFKESKFNKNRSLSKYLKVSFIKKLVWELPSGLDLNWFLSRTTQFGHFNFYGAVLDKAIEFCDSIKKDSQILHVTDLQLRWCKMCARNDISDYGYSFWRNSHQDPRLIRCPRHKLILNSCCKFCNIKTPEYKQLKAFKTLERCIVCNTLLPPSVKINILTPFETWLEELHHLSNKGIYVDKLALIDRVNQIINTNDNFTPKSRLSTRRNEAQKHLVSEYNETGAYKLFTFKKVTYDAVRHYKELTLGCILNKSTCYSPVIYALLGWVFLSIEERNELFGSFKKWGK